MSVGVFGTTLVHKSVRHRLVEVVGTHLDLGGLIVAASRDERKHISLTLLVIAFLNAVWRCLDRVIDRLLHVATCTSCCVVNRVEVLIVVLTGFSGFLFSTLENRTVIAGHRRDHSSVHRAVNRGKLLIVQRLPQHTWRFATVSLLAILDSRVVLLLKRVEVADCRWQADTLFVLGIWWWRLLVYNSVIVAVRLFFIFDDRLEAGLRDIDALVQGFLCEFLRGFLKRGLLVDRKRGRIGELYDSGF